MWHPPGCFCQTVILRDVGPRENIQTSGRPLQYPVGDETRKVDARNGILFKIGGAEYASKANELDKPSCMVVFDVSFCRLMYHMPTLWNNRALKSI